MTTIDPKNMGFSIIHHRGTVNDATTLDGYEVHRQEFVWIRGYGKVICPSYDNHFTYLDPKPVKRGEPYRWFAMCTCGSPAVITGTRAYSHLGSPSGWMLVCQHHTTYNRHADGSA